MPKRNAKETEIESKYQELLDDKYTPERAIQMLSDYFNPQSIGRWMLRKSQNQPRRIQKKRR